MNFAENFQLNDVIQTELKKRFSANTAITSMTSSGHHSMFVKNPYIFANHCRQDSISLSCESIISKWEIVTVIVGTTLPMVLARSFMSKY